MTVGQLDSVPVRQCHLFTSIMFTPDDELKAHERHLDEVIASWNMVRIAALSNLLQTAIVVLTSRPHQPIHIQHPTHSPMKNTHPIYLAYLQYGIHTSLPVLQQQATMHRRMQMQGMH